MRISVSVAVESGEGAVESAEVLAIERPDLPNAAAFGLSLAEAKRLLSALQHHVVTNRFRCGKVDWTSVEPMQF